MICITINSINRNLPRSLYVGHFNRWRLLSQRCGLLGRLQI